MEGLPPDIYALRLRSGSTPGSGTQVTIACGEDTERSIYASGAPAGGVEEISIREVQIAGDVAVVSLVTGDASGWSRTGSVELVPVGGGVEATRIAGR